MFIKLENVRVRYTETGPDLFKLFFFFVIIVIIK